MRIVSSLFIVLLALQSMAADQKFTRTKVLKSADDYAISLSKSSNSTVYVCEGKSKLWEQVQSTISAEANVNVEYHFDASKNKNCVTSFRMHTEKVPSTELKKSASDYSFSSESDPGKVIFYCGGKAPKWDKVTTAINLGSKVDITYVFNTDQARYCLQSMKLSVFEIKSTLINQSADNYSIEPVKTPGLVLKACDEAIWPSIVNAISNKNFVDIRYNRSGPNCILDLKPINTTNMFSNDDMALPVSK